MRVVLDTNILVRATPGKTGPARELLQYFCASDHFFVVSRSLLEEVDETLRYDRLRQLHGLDDPMIGAYVRDLEETAVTVLLPEWAIIPVVPDDPNDDMVIAVAIAGQAEVICTLDRHLRHADVHAYCAQHGIRIMTDVELLQLLRPVDTQQD